MKNSSKMLLELIQKHAKRVATIRAIARELREDRGRDAGYAMKAARRYVRFYGCDNGR